MNKILETKPIHFWMYSHRRSSGGGGGVTGYLIASGLILIALAARFAIAPAEAGVPFLTFFPAVTLAAVLGGVGPGLFAMVICSVLASYLFIPPFSAWPLTFHADIIWSNVVFCAEEIIVIAVVEAMYRQRSNYVATASLLEQIKAADQELKIAAAAFQSQDGVMITDAKGVILRVNQAFIETTGYSAAEAVGQTPRILKSARHDSTFYAEMWKSILGTGSWQGEIWDKRKNGEIYPKWMAITAIKAENGTITHYVATQADITARKAAEDEIKHLAFFDPLTELPNRRMLHDRLGQEIKKSQRTGLPIALLMLDLDHFKEINDTLGHDQGDVLLQEAARRLTGCIRETDTVGRLGGDEFTIIFSELKEITTIERVTQSILDALSQPFSLGGEYGYVSGSIGITLYPNDASDLGQLFKNADQAMYAAKKQGRNRYSYFTPAMQEAAQTRLHLTNDLRTALARRQFEVYYQPIVNLATGCIRKAEALIRWNHPERGLVSPAQFIPLAEDSGLINEIGNWVFYEATAQVKHWRETRHPHFQVSINKSPVQFHCPNNCQQDWINHLQALDLPGESLVVEITEGLLMETHGIAHHKLLMFRDAGIQVAIDDFGTGYSALSYLKKFDIDFLKIDQSFIRNLAPDSSDLVLCEAIIVMAHKLGLKVIAEGVELQEHRDLLIAAGCDYAQGYFFARPMAVENFETWLSAQQFPI